MSKRPFTELGLSPEVLKAVAKMGFEEASPIQSEAIPVIMTGQDVIGQSQTGSGKTAAFAIPIIERVDPAIRAPQALILCPTRELAVQVAEEVAKLAQFKRGVRELPIYGGQAYDRQLRGLQAGAHIVIGTPGRLIDHLERGTLKLEQVRNIVLDEADRMLDMGFRDEIEKILEAIPAERQIVFFSATLPPPIQGLIKRFARDPQYVKIASLTVDAPTIEQAYYEVGRGSKLEVLCRLIDLQSIGYGIIFCSTKMMVDELTENLTARGYAADKLHGDMAQTMRDRVMRRFRDRKVEFLVATDVAARGLDVENVEVVFNFDLPQDPEDYVHRIGRTGRAGKAGRAISFCYGREIYKMQQITRFTKGRIRRENVPTLSEVEEKRTSALFESVRECLEKGEFPKHQEFVDQLLDQGNTATEIASALLHMLSGEKTRPAERIMEDSPRPERRSGDYPAYAPRSDSRERSGPPRRDRPDRPERSAPSARPRRDRESGEVPHPVSQEAGMVRLAFNVGRDHDIMPGDVVGIIAGAAKVAKENIGAIKLFDRKTFVDVAEGQATHVLKKLKGLRFKGHKLLVLPAAELQD